MIPIACPLIGNEEKNNVLAVLSSGQLAAGNEVRNFETAFAQYCGTRFAVATCNGTVALHTALLASGIGPGDRVLTTPFTFAATVAAILHCGAIPVFADIDERTLNICPRAMHTLVREHQPKAAIIVHLFGIPCAMEQIMQLADSYRFTLLEDCAQAHGAEFHGKCVGTFGHAAAFSFYATKNMTTGEGGMLVTDDEELYYRARLLINHGSKDKYKHEVIGYNYRMTEIAAAIGLAQLRKLPGFTKARQANAARLTECLAGMKSITAPVVPAGAEGVFHHYTIRSTQREQLRQRLEQAGVQSGIYYPVPLHLQPVFARYASVSLPASEKASKEVLSLPVHPGLSKSDMDTICAALTSVGKSR